ncbi:MAG TPA: hypothetical protein HA306_03515 [Methanosarcina sp.]|nr:hypothetical protein [Methanosarcina sp.]
MPSVLLRILRIYLKQKVTYYGKSVHEKVIEFLCDSGINDLTLLRGIKGCRVAKRSIP